MKSLVSKYCLCMFFLSIHLLNKEYCLIPLSDNFNITPILMMLIFIFIYIYIYESFYVQKDIVYFIALFIAGEFGYLSYLNNLNILEVLKYTYFQLQQIMAFVLVYSLMIFSENIGKQLKNSLAIILIASLLIYLLQIPNTIGSVNSLHLGIFYGFDGIPRLMGFFSDPNYFSFYLSAHFYLAVLYKGITIKNRFIIYLYISSLFLAFSRAAIISNVIVLFCMAIFIKREYRLYVFKNIIALLLILGTIAFFIIRIDGGEGFLFFQEYIVYRFDFENEGSFNERQELILIGLKSIVEYPFGVGMGQQAYFIEDNFGVYKVVHNDFLGVLIEYGIIGFFVYIYSFIRIYYKNTRIAQIILLGFVLNLSTLTCYPYNLIVGVMMAMLVYNKNLIKD